MRINLGFSEKAAKKEKNPINLSFLFLFIYRVGHKDPHFFLDALANKKVQIFMNNQEWGQTRSTEWGKKEYTFLQEYSYK